MTEQQARITIEPLKTLDDMYHAVELQRVYWGDAVESIVPAHMMFTIVSYGGHVIAARDGDRIIGILIGMIGTNVAETSDRPAMANLLMASKRMVVLPEYRGQGVGFRLKLAQRDLAIKQGIRLVTWTFDPLLARNAHLNLRKLGGVSQKYHVNLYGASSEGGLATFGVSDRLKVDWWVTNRRVEERLTGSRVDLKLEQYIEGNAGIINPAQQLDPFIKPSEHFQEISSSFALLEIPLNFTRMIDEAPVLAQEWQFHVREAFDILLRSGFIVTDFLRDTHEGRDRAFYLLSYNYGFDFSLN